MAPKTSLTKVTRHGQENFSLTRMSLSELLLRGRLSPEIGSRGSLRDGASARDGCGPRSTELRLKGKQSCRMGRGSSGRTAESSSGHAALGFRHPPAHEDAG
jgi:hypothetical protein